MRHTASRLSCFYAVLAGCTLSLVVLGACSRPEEEAPPVATPELSLSKPRAPLGSPLEVTYRFKVAPTAPMLSDYRVMVHFLDADQELMWTDDHLPPKPTREWRPGETIEYSRTVFLPVYPYVGRATIAMGLYSEAGERLPLQGQNLGQRAYKVAELEVAPQSENIFLIYKYKDGWHPAEVVADNLGVEWQWMKREGIISFRNPKRAATLYLHYDGRPDYFDTPQQVTLTLAGQQIDAFSVDSGEQIIRRTPLTVEQLGSADMVELRLRVDKTFVPANIPRAKSGDARELGIRVFHAFVEPNPS